MTPRAGQVAASLFEIDAVDRAPAGGDALAGAVVETPREGDRGSTRVLAVTGWVVARERPAQSIEVSSAGRVLWELPVHDRRPDVEALHPEVEWARDAGFSGALGSLRLPPEWSLEVAVRLADGRREALARIGGRRAPLEPAEHELAPLGVTTLGRTGSSWLVHLLGAHPEIVAYRPFSFEPRAATYWMDLLMSLSEPASYTHQVDGEVRYPHAWWLGLDRRMTSELLPDSELARWLGSDSIDQLAAFAQGRIDALYRQVAAVAGGPDPAFFAEKLLPANNVSQLLHELYPDGRELFLVRDFRDMVCSILAFNDKRRRPAFGVPDSGDLDRYVREDLAPTVESLAADWRMRSGRAHLVRYEDLVGDTAHTLAAALDHAGLDASNGVVAGMIDEAAAEVPGMAEHRTAVSARASVGRWRDELPAGLQRACAEALGDSLAEFGYER